MQALVDTFLIPAFYAASKSPLYADTKFVRTRSGRPNKVKRVVSSGGGGDDIDLSQFQ
jgi:hypothetical protein